MQVFKKHSVYYLTSLLLLFVIIGCESGGGGTPPTEQRGDNEVWMQSISFVPARLTVSFGTTVTWINKDAVIHTVTSGTPENSTDAFDSGNLNNGDTFSFTFNTPGTFNYYCRLHPTQMTATIIVQ